MAKLSAPWLEDSEGGGWSFSELYVEIVGGRCTCQMYINMHIYIYMYEDDIHIFICVLCIHVICLFVFKVIL